jgi:hypothetical protein
MGDINSIFEAITKIISGFRSPAPQVPTLLITGGGKLRPGLSASLIASKIIKRQSEAGAPVGLLPSGAKNISEQMEVIRVEEIINAILQDARVDIAVDPGIPVQATGGNAGGPVVCVGATISIGSATGIIR